MSQYFEWDGFRNVYLEDSWVLGIEEGHGGLSFTVDAVLREDHPLYRSPQTDKQYCYRTAKITFDEISSIEWVVKKFQPYTDANNDVDYGNIDSFTRTGRRYELEGAWGRAQIEASAAKLIWL